MSVLSIVIPALNEEQGLGDTLRRVRAAEPELCAAGFEAIEVIVVDDGSRDGTGAVAGSYPGVRVLRHPTNQGYGAALKTGFCHATGDWLAFLDADATYPPEHLTQLCKVALEGSADVVIGSRMGHARSEMPLVRRLGNRLFAGLLSLVVNARITDSASGMRVFRKDALDQLYPLPDGLHFTPTMSTRALHEGLQVVEVPIPYHERVGRSKLSVVRDGVRFFQTIVWTALCYNPLRILGLLGMAGLVVAALVGLAVLLLRARGVTTLGPWGVFAMATALISSVIGASTYALGATFNALVALFHRDGVRQGLLCRPMLRIPLESHLGWIGLTSAVLGLGLVGVSLSLGIRGWELSRLWFYQLSGALLILVGWQLAISWLVLKVLQELSHRNEMIDRDQRRTCPSGASLREAAVGDGRPSFGS